MIGLSIHGDCSVAVNTIPCDGIIARSNRVSHPMNIEYRCISIEEAQENNYPGVDFYDDDDGYRMGIWRFEDGNPVEFLAADGGEPEDNSFYRDGSWITPALNEAYRLGVEHSNQAPNNV
jgi:hypothetical protein